MKLNQFSSRIFIILYLAATLALRVMYESELGRYFWISFITGFLALLLIWALTKSGFLNPGWFWFEKETGQEEAS